MNGQPIRSTFNIDVANFTKIKVVSATHVKDGKTFITGPYSGDFIPSLLDEADYFKGHRTASFEVTLVDDFDNQYTKSLYNCYDLALDARSESYTEFLKCTQLPNKNWRIDFSVCVAGLYRISSPKFPSIIYANLVSAEPNASRSICTITGYGSSPDIQVPGGSVNFTCNLKDSFGNSIDMQRALSNNLKVTCSGANLTFSGKNLANDNSPRITTDGFSCTMNATTIGKIQIAGLFMKNGGAWENIPSSLNSFNGLYNAQDAKKIQAFSFAENRWIAKDQIPVTLMTATEPLLTQIAFVDDNGTVVNKQNLYFNFNINEMTATIFNVHDVTYKQAVNVRWVNSGSDNYIGFSVNDYSWIKKSTPEYQLQISYKGTINTIRIQKPTGNTGGELVCIHDMLASQTTYVAASNLIVESNVDTLLATIKTRSKDGYLFNYRIDKNRFSFNLPGAYIIDGEIEGYYYLKIKTTDTGDKNVGSVKLDGTQFISDLKFKVVPNPFFAKFESQDNNRFENKSKLQLVSTNADLVPVIYNTGYDKYNSLLNLVPTPANKYLGLTLDVLINGVKHDVRFDDKTMDLQFESNYYKLLDYYKYAGNYSVTMKGDSGSPITYTYSKIPGLVSISMSYSTVRLATVEYGKQAEILLVLRDKYNNLIQSDSALMNSELKKISVKAINSADSNVVIDSFTKSSISGESIVFLSNDVIVDKVGKFILSIVYNDKAIGCTVNCSFNVEYSTFSYPNSLMNMIISNTKTIYTNTSAVIKNASEQPIFSMFFFDLKKVQLKYVDPSTVISAKIVDNKNNLSLDLTQYWKNTNELIFNFKDAASIAKFNAAPSSFEYFLVISSASKKELEYPLKLLGTAGDQDAGNGDAVLSKTVFDATTKTSIAGNEISFNFELRTKDDLRCNQKQDLKTFNLEESSGLGGDKFIISL